MAFGSWVPYWMLRGQNTGPPHSICNFVDLGIKPDYLNPREDLEDLGNRISPVSTPTLSRKKDFTGTDQLHNNLIDNMLAVEFTQ